MQDPGGPTPKRGLIARIRAFLATPPPPPRRYFSKQWRASKRGHARKHWHAGKRWG